MRQAMGLLLAAGVSVSIITLAPGHGLAVEPAEATPWNLFLTAEEAGAMKAARGDEVLFVDVREPVEIMFTGFTHMVDINIPFMLVDPSRWHPERPVLLMEENPDFAAMLEAALDERGLDKSTPVILMCRSGGDRGAPSARSLDGRGFAEVHVVSDGFEGVTSDADPDQPWRNVDGWKNSSWPWSYRLDPEKIFTRE